MNETNEPDAIDKFDGAPHAIRLPRRRHISPWASRRLLLASVIGVLLLVPLWLDPGALGELRAVIPSTDVEPSPSARPTLRQATNAATPPPGVPFASDGFTRVATSGWGSADLGGDYSSGRRGLGTFDVVGGSGRVRTGVEGSGWAWLAGPSTGDVDVTVQVIVPDQGAGSVAAGPILRVRGDSMYSVLLAATDGSASLMVQRIDTDAASDTRLFGPVALPDEVLGDGLPVVLRVQATGSDPTHIRARAWPAGQPEPVDWPVELIDWTGRLQHPGGIGISWNVSNLPSGGVHIEFDNLLAQSIDPEVVK